MKLDTVRAGIFLFTGVVGATAIVVLLSKFSLFSERTPYTIVFPVSDGVSGLIPGGEVRVGGLKRGQICAVMPRTDASGMTSHIDVAVELDADIPVYPGALVLRISPLIGSNSWLDFHSLGKGELRLKSGAFIDATSSSGALASILGPDATHKATQLVDNAAEFSAWLASVPADYRATVLPALENINTLSAKVSADYEIWREQVTVTLASAASGAIRFDETIATAKATLERDGPKVGAVLDNSLQATADLRAIMERSRGEGMDSLMQLVKRGDEGVSSFSQSVELLHDELVQRLPDLRMTVEDVRAAVGQLKLASLEIRRSPWKLLYTPTTDEVAHENLYGAARSFAMASQDLRAAGDSLREVLSLQADRFENDATFRKTVQDQLLDALKRYEQAERSLGDVLIATPPAGEGAGK